MPDNYAAEIPQGLLDLFGPPISVYTRTDAIADGSLIEVTATADEAGIRWPVALTASAWIDAVAWSPTIEDRKSECTGQDEAGRLWDVLTMLRLRLLRAAREQRAAGTEPTPSTRLAFTLLRVPAEGRGVRPRTAVLHAVIGPDDDGRPCVTVMLPEED